MTFTPFDQWIPKENLINNKYYFCKGRGFTVGKWNGEVFQYVRHKFGFVYIDTQFHWDDGPPYGTVKPFKLLY